MLAKPSETQPNKNINGPIQQNSIEWASIGTNAQFGSPPSPTIAEALVHEHVHSSFPFFYENVHGNFVHI